MSYEITEAPATVVLSPRPPGELTGLRVLIVEDESLVSLLMEEFLADLGCEVVGTASRLDEALAKVDSTTLDVAVLDVNLAGVASFPVAELLRSRRIPFVFVTGYGLQAVPEVLRTAPLLSKPYQLLQVATTLRQAMSRHRVAAESPCRPTTAD